MHHSGLDHWRDLCLLDRLAEHVLHRDPIAVLDAVALGVFGADFDQRIGIDRAQRRNLTMLRVEHGQVATSGGEHKRVFLLVLVGHLVAKGAEVRFLEVRERVFTVVGIEHGRKLYHPRHGLEPGLTVASQKPLLVLSVLEWLLVDADVAQIVEREVVLGAYLLREELARRVPRPCLGIEAFARPHQNFEVRLAVPNLDCLVHRTEEVGIASEVGQHHTVMFSERCQRQKHVAERHGCRSHEDVLIDAELDLLELLHPSLRLGERGVRHAVRPEEPRHLHGVRIALFGVREEGVGMRAREGVVERAVFGQAGSIRPHIGIELLTAVVAPLSHEARRLGERDASRNVEVPADGNDVKERLTSLDPVRHGIDRKTPEQRRRAVVGEGASCVSDNIRIDPSDLPRPLGRAILYPLGELVESIAPFLYELVVVDVLPDDDVEHRERHRGISTGTQLDMILGADAKPGYPRVDGDELRASFHQVDDGMAE